MHEIFRRLKPYIRSLLFLLLAFSAGCVLSGLFINRQRSADIGELDRRYNLQHGRAAEIIGQLEGELERERDINRKLREYNTRARELTEGLADASERNVRNLQDAIRLIGEIRTKLKILENFYVNSDSADGGN
ncbi:MAG: hypothetical protein FWC06_09025 [Treponema sp.]|nr:hypothetical protein [Treponema sp.]